MTKLLEKAFSQARALSEERQNELAELLLEVMNLPDRSVLTDEQRAEVELALKEIDEGKIATEAEVTALWRKAGILK